MFFIGITGGVGAGKSAILKHLKKCPDAKVILADELAKELMKRGTEVFSEILDAFQDTKLCGKDGEFDPALLSREIFSDASNRKKINAIVHPAVKAEVLRLRDQYDKAGVEFFFLEAALTSAFAMSV